MTPLSGDPSVGTQWALGNQNVQIAAVTNSSGRSSSVEAAKADASLLEGCDHLDELPERSGQAVESPHDEGVPRPEAVKDLGQLWPIGPSPAGTLHEDAEAAGGGQLVDLESGF